MADTPGIALLPASDHDLLIVLHTKLDRALVDLDRLADGMSARLATVEHTKAEKDELLKAQAAAELVHVDHEKRIRRLERWGFIAIGIIMALQFYFTARISTLTAQQQGSPATSTSISTAPSK